MLCAGGTSLSKLFHPRWRTSAHDGFLKKGFEMEFKDYYKVLGLNRNVASEEIERVYGKLARRYHPDVNPGSQLAQERYNDINEAHQVLTDPEARAKYDRLGASWDLYQDSDLTIDFDWSPWVSGDMTNNGQSGADPTQSDDDGDDTEEHSSFFNAIFGDMDFDKQNDLAAQQGEDFHQTLEISLEEAFTGVSRILRVGGRRLEVKIPRGASTGTKVRVRGEGAAGANGGAKGDLYLEIKLTPHQYFERVGDDLHLDLPVNVYSAVLGGEAIVPTLRGKIKLRIPPESQSGRNFRLRGQGMPNLQDPDQRGDLYAKVMITVPENLTESEIELFEELADMRGL